MEVKTGIWKSHVLSIGLISLILCPVLLFFFQILALKWPSNDYLVVLKVTVLQAFISAVCSILLGILGAMGLFAFAKSSYLRFIEIIIILPAILPPLVSILAWMQVVEYFSRMSFGIMPIIISHVGINIGLVSVVLFRLLSHALGGISAWAFLHGATRLDLIRKCLWYELKSHVVLVFILVFSFCFTSFSVPLLVGGSNAQILEVFIAESLKHPSLWPEALTVFGIEAAILLLFFCILYRQNSKWIDMPTKELKKIYLLPLRVGISVPALPALLLLWGLIGGISLTGIKALLPIAGPVLTAWVKTVLVGIGTGGMVLFLLCWIAFCLRSFFLRKFLITYVVSTQAFMGFCFLWVGLDSDVWVWFKWCAGLSLIFLPTLYRLMGESAILAIRREVHIADLMGADFWHSFIKIILPHLKTSFFFLAGVAAFWAVGDFAYSSIVSFSEQHLALLIQDVIASYRLELANILIWILLITGGFCFAFFVYLARFFNMYLK